MCKLYSCIVRIKGTYIWLQLLLLLLLLLFYHRFRTTSQTLQSFEQRGYFCSRKVFWQEYQNSSK